MGDQKAAARCTACYAEFTAEQIKGARACPSCGSTSVPMDPADDINLPINWHELRILTIWASNWAENIKGDSGDECRASLHALLRRLDKHRPDGAAALTIIGEVKELQAKFPSASLHDAAGNVIVPPKEEPPTE